LKREESLNSSEIIDTFDQKLFEAFENLYSYGTDKENPGKLTKNANVFEFENVDSSSLAAIISSSIMRNNDHLPHSRAVTIFTMLS
jgi:aspartokinase-like uncharacterized kinase